MWIPKIVIHRLIFRKYFSLFSLNGVSSLLARNKNVIFQQQSAVAFLYKLLISRAQQAWRRTTRKAASISSKH